MVRQVNSEKRDKFVRLGEKRTVAALHAIRLIGNLSNRSHYEYTETDVRKIVAALNKEISDLQRRFGEKSDKSTSEFKL